VPIVTHKTVSTDHSAFLISPDHCCKQISVMSSDSSKEVT